MADEKIKRIAREIYKEVGGEENVDKLIHCMTRVRMDIRDYSKVNLEGLKKIEGVMGVVEDDTLQVIVGPGTVNKVAQEMVDMVGIKLGDPFPNANNTTEKNETLSGREKVEEKAAQMKAAQKEKANNATPTKKVLKSIANIFVPMIPAFVGAGLIGGIAAIIQNMIQAGDLSTSFIQYQNVFSVIKNGIFAYLTIYTGINAAKEFGATPSLGGVIGGTVLLNGLALDAEKLPIPINNIFTGAPLNAGQGGIIGVIFAVWLLSLVEKQLRKVIPDAIDIIFTPTLSLLIIGLLTIFIIMPVAGLISDSLVGTINIILEKGGILAGFTLGISFLPMVMFGLHQVLTPIHIEMINQTGMTLLLPILAMAGAGQVGAALALWVRCKKDTQLVEMIKGALPVGILGIGEPLIYGVTLPLGRPFITACVGGGIGGAVIGAFGNVGAIAIGPSGAALIPLIANNQWFAYVLGLLAAYAGGFVATFFFGIPKDLQAAE
ncbi:PTS transporter subunit EIIC [Enterococcus rivorum]|uniref:Permease n=1 Tax=Enterococcus rivorum TaxID=762845 RepID=A0A1E5KW48_9ENTE|nr:PTS transporter subunit EIIC [Enterococcus rivorum]MBP2100129.1 PTS system sucrose-specific IIC component [Enterococcus rivorum]OEH82081.1 permease [Enterococcus rivorum]